MKLVDNGLHSLKKAIDNTKELDGLTGIDRELAAKETIVSLHHSIETLFKYIIREKDELLIYDNLEDYFKANINVIRKKGNKNFSPKTISFMNAVDRVVVLNKLPISDIDYGSFEHLNSVRNAITHFEYDLDKELINHLIIQVLSAVFPIYKELIPQFDEYVMDNDLNLVGSVQYKEFAIWKFIRFFNLLQKFREAKIKLDGIIQAGEIEDKVKEITKEKYITYHECPSCKKPFFVKDNLILYDTEEKSYEGQCLLCDITFDKNDSYFLYLLSEDYTTFEDKGSLIIDEFLDANNSIRDLSSEDLEEIKLICGNPENREILTHRTTDNLMWKLDELLSVYIEDIVSQYDSEVLDRALFEGRITDSLEIDVLKQEEVNMLVEIIQNLNSIGLTKEFYKEAFNQSYTFDTERVHPNPHNDNEDEEVQITIKVTLWTTLVSDLLDQAFEVEQ